MCVSHRYSHPVSPPSAYPGSRLGLSPDGPGAVATFGRRLAAVVLDWLLCQLIAYAALGVEWGATGWASFGPLAIFALENLLLVSTLGTTVGHRALGLQVRAVTTAGQDRGVAGVPGPVAGAIRTVLLCLLLPALVPDTDNRGLHDRAARTVIVRTR